MKFKVHVWRQAGPKAAGAMKTYDVDGVEAGRLVGYAGAERFKQALDRLRPDNDDGGGSPFDPTFDTRAGSGSRASVPTKP